MANTLILNSPQVFNGLGTLTFPVTVTGSYCVQVQTTFPGAVAINDNVVGNSAGIGGGLVQGQLALGGGSGAGLGAGTGGGGTGFVQGDQGTGHGGVGQGFGATNSYQQPPSAGSNVTAASPTTSSLSIVVNKNNVAQYTSTAPVNIQSALQFKTNFQANQNDTVTVVLSSSANVDNALNAIVSNVAILQGYQT